MNAVIVLVKEYYEAQTRIFTGVDVLIEGIFDSTIDAEEYMAAYHQGNETPVESYSEDCNRIIKSWRAIRYGSKKDGTWRIKEV